MICTDVHTTIFEKLVKSENGGENGRLPFFNSRLGPDWETTGGAQWPIVDESMIGPLAEPG
jgi:hypothetical protein